MSLKGVAKATIELLDRGTYEAPSGADVSIADALAASVAGTRLYRPEDVAKMAGHAADHVGPVRVSVTDETTQVAARRLSEAGAVVLNFASARNHGGGFMNGARAQEEDLCRCSGLYPTLLVPGVQAYYETNRANTSLLYTDHAIYSPGVPWFRVRGRGPLLEAPFLASVITMPAPNGGPTLRRDPTAGPAIREAFSRRWRAVLDIARDNQHRTLVLGAWGCGAFGNDPVVAAETALAWLGADSPFGGDFDDVVFAIPRKGKKGIRNHDVFAEVFAP